MWKRAAAAVVAMGLLVAASEACTNSQAEARPRPVCRGRIVLVTEETVPVCNVEPPTRMDMLVEAWDLSRALDACDDAGGRLASVTIHRARWRFGELVPGDPFVRCNDIDY